ncbi:MAG TPA: hypothetical protein VHR97_06790 [Candidatus Baltobacteraceae bacterium]|nr:hypothetical protein [Candidatus Baltobacteraceae bacterium]
MRGLLYRRAFGAAVATALLTACGGSGAPSTAAVPQTALSTRTGATVTRNVSGEYAGTIDDNQDGTSAATAALAQYNDGVGGPFTVGTGSSSLISSIAFTLDGKNLTGTLVKPGTTACSFATSATYDRSNRRLAGSYYAISGCSGEQGTYTLKRKCFYQRAGDSLKPLHGPQPC